eukprot:Tbor_TRINITY_DN5782_c1_g1::TRINITY_DN5782_c1_g1_i4::g.19834::m.19834
MIWSSYPAKDESGSPIPTLAESNLRLYMCLRIPTITPTGTVTPTLIPQTNFVEGVQMAAVTTPKVKAAYQQNDQALAKLPAPEKQQEKIDDDTKGDSKKSGATLGDAPSAEAHNVIKPVKVVGVPAE